MKRACMVLVTIFIFFFAGCDRALKTELTIEEAISRETIIKWSPFMGELPLSCSIPDYLDSLVPDEKDINDYDFVYTFIDIDGDNNRDVIVADSEYPIAFVIIKRGKDYYGGALHGRQAQQIYSSGYILNYDGGGNESYYRIKLENEELIAEDFAIITCDNTPIYILQGEEVTKQEYDAWVEENCKEEVTFEHYEKND